MRQAKIAIGFLAVACLSAGDAGAQWSFTWADISCANSRLAAPSNATCRATNEVPETGARSFFKFYSYVVGEDEWMMGLMGSGQIAYQDVVTSASDDPLSKDGRNFGAVQNAQGAQYLTFELNSRKCVRGMRFGVPNPNGSYMSWVRGNKCAPAGQALSPEATSEFLARLVPK